MHDDVRHALSYPFPIPDYSFLFGGGTYQVMHAMDIAHRDRAPVLAAGSNQSPEQLTRKYHMIGDAGAIPAERGVLHDFDVVYAAHLSAYGSVPATFQSSPGTAVTVFVLWLTEGQLLRMHETEGNYFYDRLPDIRVETDFGETLTEAFAYTARNGCFNHRGGPLALAEISAINRHLPEAGQAHAQEFVRDRIVPEQSLEDFVTETIHDERERHRRVAAMAEDALPPAFERETLMDLGN